MTSELIYREISCQKSVDGSNFAQGVQDYSFSMGQPTGWIPSRSYFRIEMTLEGLGVPANGLGANPQFANNSLLPIIVAEICLITSISKEAVKT